MQVCYMVTISNKQTFLTSNKVFLPVLIYQTVILSSLLICCIFLHPALILFLSCCSYSFHFYFKIKLFIKCYGGNLFSNIDLRSYCLVNGDQPYWVFKELQVSLLRCWRQITKSWTAAWFHFQLLFVSELLWCDTQL